MVDVLEVKMSADLLSIVSIDTVLKRVADTGGGEYAGMCPFCGGEDRFRVQLCAPPGKKPSGSRWMCRGCTSARWGDVISYVEKRQKTDFGGALAWLADLYHLGDGAPVGTPSSPMTAPAKEDDINRAIWTDAALAFLEYCIEQLWTPEASRALGWLHDRGLTDDELRLWPVGFNPAGNSGRPEAWGLPTGERIYIPRGIVIGCQDAAGLHYLKVRQAQGTPKYLVIKGGRLWPFGMQTFADVTTAFLFESELDVMLAHGTGLTGAGYASMPAGQPVKTEYQPFFDNLEDVIVCFDNDAEGQKAAAKLCKMPSFHRAELLPMGKDLTEFGQAGGDVLEYLLSQLSRLKGGTP